MKKVCLAHLALEITRRCNMSCAHCLRGGAQRKDIDFNIISSLLSRVKEIQSLVFTGGEPTLNVSAMRYTLDYCKSHGIKVSQVWLATNGKRVTDEFLDVCRQWHIYTLETEFASNDNTPCPPEKANAIIKQFTDSDDGYCEYGCFVALSLDNYHEAIPVKNVYKLLTLPHLTLDKAVLNKNPYNWIIGTGRAKDNDLAREDIRTSRPYMFNENAAHLDIELMDYNDCCAQIDEMYVTVDGDVLNYCDYSYKDMKKHAICHIGHEKHEQGKWLDNVLACVDTENNV